MRLKKFLLRYYPPGIILEYEQSGLLKSKSIDLLDLKPTTDVDALLDDIVAKEPLITPSKMEQVRKLIIRLQEKLAESADHHFYLFKVLRAHILPLTNVAFNKSGTSFITGSYDRTCKVWDTASGEELQVLEGHKNVVYAIAFNNPYGDKIATGSFDKTCKLWSADTGKCYHTYRGHTAEIVSSIIVPFFRRVHTLIGHRGEISNAQFNFDSSFIVTGSMDKTCKIWDSRTGQCIGTLSGHDDEVLDVCFDYTGQYIATASADGTGRVYNALTHHCMSKLEGHEGEISKITFSPQGRRCLTASSDKTARLWDPFSGKCMQVLEGHTDEIFSCAFNYEGNIVITGSRSLFSLLKKNKMKGLGIRRILILLIQLQVKITLRLVFTCDRVVVGVVIRSVERYNLVKINRTESEEDHRFRL
ncbi:PREDICTED: dynein assembly factor with WDR repeat domains 1-like [Acropora digitifera]|uniref:dynein assembly factor with WDR repeat domains 1-like n=1 Tax=Acropora digitifera TaxID=70779 RepID=UPI00077AA342|nr:PREDICTED: dynein assembly factor with WDR repeat domains 1-like [Acropora digitifera]